MKLVCKVDHVSLPLNGTHRLVIQNEVIELQDEQAYLVLSSYPNCFVKAADEVQKKVVLHAEQVK